MAKKFSNLLLTPVRAKHSENSLFIKLIICRPNASPLRLLTPMPSRKDFLSNP
ncbi:hypothetical protein H5968_21680 [Sphaerospermopsis sp. LEGE 00249]|uniref:hypothetical protein n=1 Tax=Sphaerospermopsis sp. LEGE 00249 TaxID=1380707 RepID=UPI00164E67CF|nr:hypothetical protein [Sphaerospermopsis sp. LEGE 00249]MBC5797688.1 hypothetical protein [Sphaerospermopsis sp. LEGE 00249]